MWNPSNYEWINSRKFINENDQNNEITPYSQGFTWKPYLRWLN